MTHAVLKIHGHVVPRQTSRRLNTEELHSDSEKAMRNAFDDSIKNIHGDSMSFQEKTPYPDCTNFSDLDDEDEYPFEIPYCDPVEATGKAIYENPFTNMLIHAKLFFCKGIMFNLPRFRGKQRMTMETSLALLTPTQF